MRIGELAGRSGISPKTIRYYEQAGVLPRPARDKSGYREYGPEAVDRLRFVRQAQAAGLSLREVRQIMAIREGGDVPCEHVRSILHARLNQVRAQLAELVTLECHLETVLEHGLRGEPTGHDTASFCWILESEPRPRAARDRGVELSTSCTDHGRGDARHCVVT